MGGIVDRASSPRCFAFAFALSVVFLPEIHAVDRDHVSSGAGGRVLSAVGLYRVDEDVAPSAGWLTMSSCPRASRCPLL
jgi:hypothetical protein